MILVEVLLAWLMELGEVEEGDVHLTTAHLLRLVGRSCGRRRTLTVLDHSLVLSRSQGDRRQLLLRRLFVALTGVIILMDIPS